MSAAAVLRSACRALRRPSSSFPVTTEHLFLHRRSPIASRRLYSSVCSSIVVNKPPKLNNNSAAVERMSGTVDSMIGSYDRMIGHLTEIVQHIRLEQERKLAIRRRRALFGGVSIIAGLAMYAKQRSKKKTDQDTSTEQQKMS